MEGTAFVSNNLDDDRYWRGFKRGDWCYSIAVRDFIVRNVSPYAGDETFLVGPSKRTQAVWEKLQPYFQEEQKKGVLAVDAKTPSTLLAHQSGYIDRENEVIVGLQTDQPFKRAIFPFGGLRMVEAGPLPLPGHALTAPSSMAHSIWPGDDSEGSPLQDAITSRRNLVFGGPKDPDHDALMRISGEAPRRRAHSAQRHESLVFGGSPPPRIVIGDPSRSSGSSRVCTS